MIARHIARGLGHLIALIALMLAVLTVALWIRAQWIGDRLVHEPNGYFHAALEVCRNGVWVEYTPGVSSDLADPDYWIEAMSHERESPSSFDMATFTSYLDVQDPFLRRYSALGAHFIVEPSYGPYGRGVSSAGPEQPWGYYNIAFIPFGWLLLTFALPPACWLWWRRRRRVPLGRCKTCGYDLRASAGSCPECGMAVD